jgi:hypothetical protein
MVEGWGIWVGVPSSSLCRGLGGYAGGVAGILLAVDEGRIPGLGGLGDAGVVMRGVVAMSDYDVAVHLEGGAGDRKAATSGPGVGQPSGVVESGIPRFGVW